MMAANDVVESILLTSQQAAAYCGMSRAAWYKHLSAGKVPRPVKIGSLSRWRRDELRAWSIAGCPDRAKWEAASRKDDHSA